MKITITNPNTGEKRKINISDNFRTFSEEDKQKTIDEIYSELNWKSKETIEFENELAEKQAKIEERQMPAAGTGAYMNPFYSYSPIYLPLIFLAVFVYLIIKKRINKGWARLCALLSIFWASLVILGSILLDFYRLRPEANVISLIKNVGLTTFIPILTFTFLCWGIAWIKEGFKENK